MSHLTVWEAPVKYRLGMLFKEFIDLHSLVHVYIDFFIENFGNLGCFMLREKALIAILQSFLVSHRKMFRLTLECGQSDVGLTIVDLGF